MLDPGKPSFTPKKGKPSIVMFVGLQGTKKVATFEFFLFGLFYLRYYILCAKLLAP